MAAIRCFRVQHFRSVDDSTEVEVAGDVVPIIGKNGVGKTNTLCALAHLSNSDPVDRSNLSRYSFADQGDRKTASLGSIKIASVRIENLHEEQYPFFNTPFTFDDIDIEVDPVDTPDLILGPQLEVQAYWLAKYANGRRVLEFPDSAAIPSLDLYEFIQQRRQEFLIMIETAITASEVKRYVGSSPAVTLTELSTAQSVLETVLDRLGWAVEANLSEYDKQRIGEIEATLNELATRAAELDEVGHSPEHVLPPVVDARDIEMPSGPIELANLTTHEEYRGLLSLADINPGELRNIPDKEAEMRLEEAAAKLEEYLNGFWDLTRDMSTEISRTFPEDGTDRFVVEISVKDSGIKLQISESGGPLLPISELSTGLQWVIAFLLRVIDNVGERRRDAGIFILDDVGDHLHPGAQRFLLETIRSISAGNQIIYCTHSPFLIDVDDIRSVRIANWNPDTGTTLDEELPRRQEGEIDAWYPVREALGAKVARLPFAANRSILVEGYTEIMTFQEVNTFLRSLDGWRSIDRSINVIDFDGSKAGPLSKFLEAEGFEHVILLDGDKGGSDTADGLADFGIDTSRITFLDDIDGLDELDADPAIEDIFGPELYANAAADCQPDEITRRAFRTEFENQLSQEGCSDLSDAAKRAAHKLGGKLGYSEDERVTNKGRFAKATVDILFDDWEGYEGVLERFETVLHHLEEELEGRQSGDGMGE